jgi:hypothetical protein
MLTKIIVLSLIITGVHVSLHDGMLLNCVRIKLTEWLTKAHMAVLSRPLYDCNICMGGIYTLVLYPLIYGLDWYILPTMVGVIGANTLIAALLKYLYNDEN